MTQQDDLEIRTMSRDQLDIAVEWAAREGWNPGLHDAECFHATDPDGFLIGLLARLWPLGGVAEGIGPSVQQGEADFWVVASAA